MLVTRRPFICSAGKCLSRNSRKVKSFENRVAITWDSKSSENYDNQAINSKKFMNSWVGDKIFPGNTLYVQLNGGYDINLMFFNLIIKYYSIKWFCIRIKYHDVMIMNKITSWSWYEAKIMLIRHDHDMTSWSGYAAYSSYHFMNGGWPSDLSDLLLHGFLLRDQTVSRLHGRRGVSSIENK